MADHPGAGQRVVLKARSQCLAGFAVIDEFFAQRLADSLHGTALELADDDHRIDDAPNVVDGPIVGDLHGTRVWFNFDFADVTAVRPRLTRDGTGRVEDDPLLRLPFRELEETNAPIRAADPEDPVVILDVADRGFEFDRGQVLRALDGTFGGHPYRGSADKKRAGSRAAESRPAIGITLHNPDLLDRDAKNIDRDLRECGR